jgi:hypothetical protein
MPRRKTKERISTNLILPEGVVRTTPDKRVSVFDSITAATGAKNAREVWNRLKAQYPEVVTTCDSYKCSGRGQLPTPVTNKEGFVHILGLLPGAQAEAFRRASAKLIVRFFEGDPTLAEEIIERVDDPEALERIELRAKTKRQRLIFTQTIQAHGGVSGKQGELNTYRDVSGMFNKAVTGNPAKAIQEYTGESNTRDGLPSLHLTLLMLAEELFAHNVNESPVYGHHALVEAGGQVCTTIRQICQAHRVPHFPPGRGQDAPHSRAS